MPEFRIQRCLGRGGFGEVYRGVMSRGGGVEVEVAIKVLRPDLEPESQGVQRLRDEGRLLGRLTHPTILRVYDMVVIQGRAALVSEYVAGEDLGRLLREDRIPPRAVFEVVAQVAAALDAAWSWPSVTDGKALHLVHRDVKPDNIRIDPHGVVKLLDFGIAQAQTVWREAQTSVNTIMGSTHYLAPERLVQQEVGPEADVFALGCTLFEALTGEALFARKSMRQMYVLMVDERRFEEFVGERCEARKDRLGCERSTALIRAMTAWRKGSRPTGADVASRCDTISDSTEGLTLTQWCRTRVWPEARGMDGPLDGYTFVTSQPGAGAGAAAGAPVFEIGAPDPDEPAATVRTMLTAPPVVPEPPALPAAPPPEPARPEGLGETGSASMPGHEGPLPWSAAEMVAVLASAPEVVLRIPQLGRQNPEPPILAAEPVVVPAPPEPEPAPEPEDRSEEEDAVTEVNDEIEVPVTGLSPRPTDVPVALPAELPEPGPERVPEGVPEPVAVTVAVPEPAPGAEPESESIPSFRFEGAPPVMGDAEEYPTVRMIRLTPVVAAPREATPDKPPGLADGPTEITGPPVGSSRTETGSNRAPRRRGPSVNWLAGASGAAGLVVGVLCLLVIVLAALITRGIGGL